MSEVGKFYKKCWNHFSKKEQKEALYLLKKRLKINNVSLSLIKGKECLDLGCGSGRYSMALLSLGAKSVVGVDTIIPKFKHQGFVFKKASVLDVPLKSKSFDFVFCNGVLHHTTNWKKGIREAFRLLKPGGWLWLYTIGNNKVWKTAEKVRRCMIKHKGIENDIRNFLFARDWQPNKVFFLLDMFCTPHRILLSKKQVKTELKKHFVSVKYLSNYVENVPPGTHLRFIAKKGVD